jgi:hypothetical protein
MDNQWNDLGISIWITLDNQWDNHGIKKWDN